MAQIILTKNAVRKISENNLSQRIVEDVIGHGDRRLSNRAPGITEFRSNREFGQVTVIGKRTPKGDWLVLTCWLKNSGSTPIKQPNKSQKTSIIEAILQIIKDILFKR